MISVKVQILVVSVLVLIMLQTTFVLSIKCWDCDSYQDKNCGEPFNNRTLSVTDCSQIADRNMQKCRKITQRINGFAKFTQFKITRGCLIDDHTSHQLSEASIELCSKDGCNSAQNQMPFMFMAFLSPVLIGFQLMR